MPVVKVDVRFSDNVAELKERIAAGTGAIEVMKQSVDRVAASMGGQGLFIQANKLTAAIDQLGGVTKLTAAEQERASATLDKAIEKYKVMGMTAPPAMIELRESMNQAQESAVGFLGTLSNLGDSWVARIAEGMLLRDAIREVIHVVKDMAEALPELAMRGSEIAAVQHGFELLAGSTKNADDILQAMRSGTRNTVDDFALMKDATKLLSAGVELTAKDFGTLTEASVVLAHRGFGDTTEILNKLSDAMITGKTKTAAKMLGVIDAKGAELDYQTALDSGIDKLTAQGKAEAVRGALMEKLENVVRTAGEQHITYAERVAQAKTAVANFTDSLGVAIATSPVIDVAMSAMGEAFQTAFGRNQADTVQGLMVVLNTLAIKVVDVGLVATQIATVFVTVWSAIKVAVLTVTTVIVGLITGIGEALLQAEQLAGKLHLVSPDEVANIKNTQVALRGMTVSLAEQTAEAARGVVGQSEANKSIDAFAGKLYVVKDAMEAANAKGVTHTEIINALGAAHEATSRGTDKLTAAEKEWLKVVADVESAGDGWRGTLATINGTVVEGIKYYLEAGVAQDALAKYYALTAVQVKAVDAAMKDEAKSLKDTIVNIEDSRKTGEEGAAAVAKGFAGMSFVLKDLAVQTGGTTLASKQFTGVMGLMADQSDVAAQHMARLRDDTKQVNEALGAGYQVLGMVGGKFGEIGQIAVRTFDAVSKRLAEGDVFGAIVAGAMGAFSALKTLFGGVSQVELEGRKVEASFEQSFGGFQGMMTAVGGAYAATGRTAAQAQADVAALMNAEKQGGSAVQAMIDKINGVFDEQKAKAASVSAAVQSILDTAKTVGGTFPAAMQPMITNLLSLPGLTDDETKSLQALLQAGQPSFSDLTAAAGRYGLTLDTLGGKAAQLSISNEADQIESDYKTLVTDSGADSDKVLAGMKDSLTKLVDHAMDAGAVLPTALQPLVKQLFDTGQLTDTAGDKITDLSKLKFDDSGDPLASGMKSLTDAITNLGKILTDLPGTAQKAADDMGAALSSTKVPALHVPLVFDRGGDDPTAGYAAMGGLVTNHGIQYLEGGGTVLPFIPRGTDTVPTMLTPGEGVVSRAGMATIGTNGLRALNRGGGQSGGGEVVQFSTAALERKLEAGLAAIAAESRRAPDRTAMAVRDAFLQARVGRN